MGLIICQQSQSVIDSSLDWIKQSILSYGIDSFYLPAGETPTALYQTIENLKLDYLQKVQFYQIDDISTGEQALRFKRYFQKQLPSYQSQMHWIDEGAFQAKAAILGLGLNGHCAFHEPHLPANFRYGEVSLSPQTCQTLGLEPGTRGLSYGLGMFTACLRVLVLVTGSHKANILQRLLDADELLPASQLCEHPDFTIICDAAAAGFSSP